MADMPELLQRLEQLDFSRLLSNKRSPLQDARDRADARIIRFVPITPAERLQSFLRIGYRPHGMFVPADPEAKAELIARVQSVGSVEHHEARMRAYFALQDETELWEAAGVVGKWTGQQAIARSPAPFRIVAFGRRSGKSYHAAREIVGLALARPRSWSWVAAPTMDLVSRVFDYVIQLLGDLGIKPVTCRNSAQEKLVVLDNGAKVEGVSLDRPGSAAGASVDFVVIDEAAQVGGEAWIRDILPPLADRNGQALLISSWEGEGGFFHDKATDVVDRPDADWEMMVGASWDNFFEFPKGRKDTKILRMEKETPAIDFLEQFGAIPARKRGLVFPEFKERIHVGDFPYNPDHPVRLAIDPSGGSNPYAVGVFQDYGDLLIQIDEFYEPLVTAEQVMAKLKTRFWADVEDGRVTNVTDAVMDSASPPDIWRWGAGLWPAYPVPEKPQVWIRLPYIRRILRDPARFHDFYRAKVNAALMEMGYPPDIDKDLSPEKQRALAIQVEEALSDHNLTDSDVETLRGCSKFFVDRRCVNTIKEYKNYSYTPERKTKGPVENPQDKWNDVMDLTGYYVWTFRRDEASSQTPVSYLAYKNLMAQAKETVGEAEAVGQNRQPGVGWLSDVRERFVQHRHPLEPRSYLRVVK